MASSSTGTQYDAIGLAYESLKQLPAAQLERDNLHAAIEPFLTTQKNSGDGGGGGGATVLDLACGTGYYSRLLLDWGAARVVGVDVSEKMIDAAREQARAQSLSVLKEENQSPSQTVDEAGREVKLETGREDKNQTLTATQPEMENHNQTAAKATWRTGFNSGTGNTGPVSISRARPDPEHSNSTVSSNRLTFQVGDCTQPLELPLTPAQHFDIVLGAWLLNYASSAAEMTEMFANVTAHLRPGGRFVGITPHPAKDLDAFARDQTTHEDRGQQPQTGRDRDRHQRHGKPDQAQSPSTTSPNTYGVSVTYRSQLPNNDGYATSVTAHVSPVQIQFDNYHLRREVYERWARQAGLKGCLEWRDVHMPTPQDGLEKYGVAPEFWDGYLDAPHFGILVIEK